MKTKHYSTTAVIYAQSLLELAEEKGQTDAIGTDLASLADAIANDPGLKLFTIDPSVSMGQRSALLKRAFEGKISPLLLNFLGVLNAKGRLNVLTEISDAYQHLQDEKNGKIEVDVTVAQRLSQDQLDLVQQKVSSALGKKAVVQQFVDDSIIGGLTLRVEDKLIDASVKYQLEAMKEQLLAARPK